MTGAEALQHSRHRLEQRAGGASTWLAEDRLQEAGL